MKLYAAFLVVAVVVAIIGVATDLWLLVGLGVVIGFAGFVMFVRNAQGTHPRGSKL